MSAIAGCLEAFFAQRLSMQLGASAHTVTSYRDTFRLLLCFASERLGTPPSKLDFSDMDAELVGAFLDHLEKERGNSVATRNVRLAAIRSFFAYAAYREPAHAETIARVLAIPEKRTHRTLVSFLTETEIAALLASPDRSTWTGRRDHALLHVACQCGLRVSELTRLTNGDVILGERAYLLVHGKGRKQRATPLTRPTVRVLKAWVAERGGQTNEPFFPTVAGGKLSHDAVAWLVDKHVVSAKARCSTLSTKKVTPHTLRHSCAMRLLGAGVDTSVIALWLGHEHVQSTQIYLHGDLSIKERAIARTAPPETSPGRYRPPDALLAFLASL